MIPFPGSRWPARLRATVLAVALPEKGSLLAILIVPLGVLETSALANATLTTRSPEAFPRTNPVLDFLTERADGWRVLCRQSLILDLEAQEHELLKVQDYEPAPIDQPLQALAVALNPKSPLRHLHGFSALDMRNASDRLLDLWSARFIILRNSDRGPNRTTGWKHLSTLQVPSSAVPAGSDPIEYRCMVWENQDALPRGFVVGRARVLRPGETEPDALDQLDPRSEVLLEQDVLPSGPRQDYTPARRLEDTPNRVDFEVETSAPGYLVLADTWYPGWSATVDGRTVPVQRANIAFRAVALPEPGKHRVVFSYYPVGLNAGLVLSLTTVVLLSVVYFRGRTKGARSWASSPPWRSKPAAKRRGVVFEGRARRSLPPEWLASSRRGPGPCFSGLRPALRSCRMERLRELGRHR